MIDLNKYNLDEDDIYVIESIYASCESVTNLSLCYKNKIKFDLDSWDGKTITAYFSDDNFIKFNSVDDLLVNFKIEDKPLIEIIKDVDFI